MVSTERSEIMKTKIVNTQEYFRELAVAFQSFSKEPIGEWMRRQGRHPEQWRLILPNSLVDASVDYGCTSWPSYVEFSLVVSEPMFVLKEFTIWKFE